MYTYHIYVTTFNEKRGYALERARKGTCEELNGGKGRGKLSDYIII